MLKFEYEKADGSVSNRVVAQLPNFAKDMLLGVDITEMDPKAYELLNDELKSFFADQNARLYEFLEGWDLRHNIKTFKASGMKNISVV